MGHLAPAEHHGHLDLVPVLEKPPSVPRLRVEVVVIDTRPVLHFLEQNDVLLFLRLARLLGLLEFVFAVVHDADHGWPRERRDFDQIQSSFECRGECRVPVEDSELRPVGRDDPQRTDADLLIDAYALGDVLNGYGS